MKTKVSCLALNIFETVFDLLEIHMNFNKKENIEYLKIISNIKSCFINKSRLYYKNKHINAVQHINKN